ncbi:MAG: cysteine desulfurase [Methanomicrobiales archaeon]|nr:cysteine desulfurase [Methanomicrobiales archaeon]MDD1668447.1 cysteine desulfurase [Methanomicrobiales archaeon]
MIPPEIRADFPILSEVCYLDSAATSLSPEPVLAAMLEFEHTYRANVGRGVHRLAQVASQKYWDAHRKVKSFIGAETGELVFTRNTTEAINMIAWGLPWQSGDGIVTTLLEHHSNLLPWMRLRDQKGIDLQLIAPAPDGGFDLAEFEKAVTLDTRLVAITHASNVLGNLVPVREIAKICRDRGALLLVDGAQSVPHVPVDVERLGCDFFCFSGHKMLGPTGTGALWMRRPEIEPLLLGGGAVEQVTASGYTLASGYARFEAGTPNIAGAIGLSRAIDYLEGLSMDDVQRHEQALTRRMLDGLSGIDGVKVFGPGAIADRIGVVSFAVGGLHPHDVAMMLDTEADIMVRSGHHCCMPLMDLLGTPGGTVRASLHCYNNADDIDRLVETVGGIAGNL